MLQSVNLQEDLIHQSKKFRLGIRSEMGYDVAEYNAVTKYNKDRDQREEFGYFYLNVLLRVYLNGACSMYLGLQGNFLTVAENHFREDVMGDYRRWAPGCLFGVDYTFKQGLILGGRWDMHFIAKECLNMKPTFYMGYDFSKLMSLKN